SYSESASNGTITINPLYTFNTFVVGKQNELAHAAAQAVANQPGGTYNPLFIYGGVGLGKTHLLHGIANEIRRRNGNVRILYVTCERFTNDFINAIRSGKGKEFKDRYRNVDLLLIDDIQFITGKEGTQEEFFHTFNALHQENKQIVVCSDRPPRSIAGLEKRLQSRLEWGMLVDVGTPDLETRIAILQRKCMEKNFSLDRDILHYVASTIYSNVRELEGALNKIIAVHQFRGMQPTLEGVKPIVASFESENVRKTVTPRQLITVVSEYFDITIEDILGKSREKKLAFPRQIIMYLLREEMKNSYPAIGTELGGRDHTTAMHAYTKIAELLIADEKLQKDLELIKQKLYTG
ncbi:MAG: chromosomal replication initiator protein DnaA, partial [Candidatus Uhrbacteria bacterium]|nr:chromosomal replication initiator protein DnaA [Candidatus Uhrbacteria bacterium]